MEANDQSNQEDILAMFNVSGESDDIEIKLDENFEASTDMVGRRC